MGFFEEHKKRILMAVSAFLLICTIFTFGRKTNATFFDNTLSFIITPLQNLTTDVGDWVGSRISNLLHKADLNQENEKLKKKIAELEADNKRLSLYETENKKLSELLKITQRYQDYDTIGAQIIAKDPGNWYDTFVIDKGKKSGVAANMVVTAAGGLVGKITESGYAYAKAQSILDSRSSVSAMSLRTEDLGVIKGEYSLMDSGLCRMEYIDANAEIMVGDEIVTSNLSEYYPPGISIGHVKEIKTDTNGLTKFAIIEPTVDFKHLDTIVVIGQIIDKEALYRQTEETAPPQTEEADTIQPQEQTDIPEEEN